MRDKKPTLVLQLVCCVALGILSGCGRTKPDSIVSHDKTVAAPGPSREHVAEADPVAGVPVPTPRTAKLSSALIHTPLTKRRNLADQRVLKPREDGWTTEAFAETATSQLDQLGRAMGLESAMPTDRLASLATAGILVSPLRPSNLSQVFRDPMIEVQRLDGQSPSSVKYHGRDGLNEAIRRLAAFFTTPASIESHFKIVQVHRRPESISTKVIVQLHSDTAESADQINTTWDCTWQQKAGANPQLCSIQVTDYEQVKIRAAGGRWFSDCTAAVLGDDPALWRQLAHGHHYWLQRIERVQRFDTSIRNGLALGDVNGDGLDDLYVCQPPGLPNRLFVRRPDGTATERAAAAGVDWLDQTSAALFCDLDNDDDQDLVLGTAAGILLMQNDGRGNFELKKKLDVDYDVQSLSSVDYNNNGRLDLFVCVYRTDTLNSQSFLYRDATGGGLNRLFRNDGTPANWEFTDATAATGLDDGADRYSLAASWEDFDNDGDQDLYVANDFGRNYLYENRDGQFVDVAGAAGVVDVGSGMSVSWGDHNRDGLMDLYVGNMFSSAGQRVTMQPEFRAAESEPIRKEYQRLAKGNSLFTNQGDGTFRETGRQAGVELGRWAWSSLFVDVNNDGWEDLLVANGYMTTEDTGDL